MDRQGTRKVLMKLYDRGFNDGVNFMRNALYEPRVHPVDKALSILYPESTPAPRRGKRSGGKARKAGAK